MNSTVVKFCETGTRVAGVTAAAIGGMGLLGWILDIEALRAAFTGGVSMKANAAVCLMLSGIALVLLAPQRERLRRFTVIGRIFAGVVITLGGLTLAEHLSGRDFGIDQLLFHEPPGALATMSPGRMGPPASTSFLLSGFALLLLDLKTKRGRLPAQWLGLAVGLIAMLPVIGYVYRVQSLYGISKYTGIAIHTALAILLLAIGLMMARPTSGIMAVVAANDAGGIMARRLLIPAILIPFILGWLTSIGERYRWFDDAFGRPVLILSLIVSFVVLIWWSARGMSVLGRQRTRAEEEREQHEEALRASEARLSAILNNAPAIVYVVDAENRFRFINQRWESVFDLDQQRALGRSIYDFFAKEVADQFAQTNRRVLEGGKAVESEEVVPQADGKHTYISVKVPLLDSNGNPYAVCGISTDITDRKRTEIALRGSEERLRLAVSIAQMGTFEIDLRSDVVTVNETGREIYGWAEDEPLTFARVQGQFHAEDRDEVMRRVQGSFDPAGAREFELEQRIIRTDGATRWIRVRGRAQFETTAAGLQAVRCVGTFIDITEQKEAERERESLLAAERRARSEAERASEAKSEFLATLSHELRTPLTPVLLTVSLMESHPDLPADLRDDVATIRRNVELESRLISDLLDLTRIAKGKLQLDMQDVDVHLIIRSAIDICQREASAKLNVELRAARHVVRGDSTRLQQIFWNLINNAQKFTGPDGTITVRSTDAPDERVRIEISDTGCGIDAEVLPRLFTAFEQGDVRVFRQQAGLGLGLAISRKLAEAHGGTISATSAGRGAGATFTVELPAVNVFLPEPHAQRPPTSRLATRPLAVLLIEDHEPTLTVMTRLLRGLGHQVTGATSVASGTAAARQDGFDVIISDLGLPDGSGLDIMRELRDRYAGRAIALTGYGMEEDIAASRDAGFADHLTKPVDVQELEQAISRITG